MAHKDADWEALFYALRAGSNKVTEESGFMEDEECSAYADKCAKAIYEMALECKNHRTPVNSSKSIKSDFDDYGNWVDDEKPIKKEDMHGSFRKLSQEEHDELKPQVEEELDRWMSRKHFGLDKEVYDETVEYIISLFGEDNYAPKDVKEAVSSWYNDTLDSFPEMLKGKGDKRKIASVAYLKQIKSSHYIKSSRKPIKSSLSDVNKALGFTDNDIEEDGRIHITTDFGEFVVDYVNDEYIVSYDGEERTFTEYKDTVKEVVDLFNKLCNEEVEFFKAGSFDKAWEKAVAEEEN